MSRPVENDNSEVFIVEPLNTEHAREAFSCGTPALDNYLKKQARQDVKKRAAVVYVLTPDGKTIAGYYAVSQFAIDIGAIPPELSKQLPRYNPLPATLLGRLAIDLNFRGRRLGEYLLMDVFARACQASKSLASVALVVDAKDEAAITFYKKYGFRDVVGIPNRLFIPLGDIEKALG